MKKTIMTLALGILFSLSASLPALATESVKVGVNGMVCAFCAQGIQKKFEENPAVEKCHVDLDKKEVEIQLKKDKTLSDDEIKRTIKDAGYAVTKLKRDVLRLDADRFNK